MTEPDPPAKPDPFTPGTQADLDRIIEEIGLEHVHLDDVQAITSHVFGSRADLTARELADAVGDEVEDVVMTYALLGVEIDDVDERLFRKPEIEFLKALRSAVDALFSDTEGNDLLRVMGTSMARIADAAISGYVGEVEQRLEETDAPPRDWLAATLFGVEIVEQISIGLSQVLIHHFRSAIDRQRLAQVGAASRLEYRYAVGFVDLVGFTEVSGEIDARELSHLMRSFENTAHDLAGANGGRIVKHIGDEVMFTALDPAAACVIGLSLIREIAEGEVVGRGGVAYGDLVSRGGDYYGPVVNLASRLTDVAVDGELLVDEAVHDAVADDLDLEPAGRRKLKGFADPIRTWSLVVD